MIKGVRPAFVILLIVFSMGLAGCGGGSGNSTLSSVASVTSKASPKTALKKKLETCASLYNRQETARMMQNPTEPGALITTDSEGNCVVAFDPHTGGADGSVGAVTVVRSPQGEWGLYISSEEGSTEELIHETSQWEVEREEAPNAEVVAGPSIVDFVPSAPLPRGALLAPPLVTKPAVTECSLTVKFSGGEVGAFTAALEEAAGISCSEAQRVVSKVLTEPGFEGFECSSEGGGITEAVYQCSKGFDEFRFTTSPAGQSDAGGTTGGPSSERAEVETALKAHFEKLIAGKFAAAFEDLSPSAAKKVGGEDSWIEDQRRTALTGSQIKTSVSFDGRYARARIKFFRTESEGHPDCEIWSGVWGLVKFQGRWLIEGANLTSHPC